ncbi:MAG: polysaccharide deacetylase family protein, partial [Peptostreptococcaceae bacterium]|nr:polysaccharide deacetylase family protein [Peptostreptococcaceae bacterium]
MLFASINHKVYAIDDEEVFIKNGPRDKKLIALTFDDGPHPKETDKVLDVLTKYNVKATFFIAGKHANWYKDPLI